MEASLKKNILIGIVSGAGLLLLLAAGWLLYFKLQFSVYHDDQYKFSIKYPSHWKVVIHPDEKVAVIFLRPKDTALDTVQENLNVTIQPVPDDIFNLAQFSARVKTQMTAVFDKNIKIVEEKPLQWSGWHEGHMMVIDAPTPDHLKLISAWGLNNNRAYILTFWGDMNKYSQDALVINEMIHSFELQ